MSESSDPAPSTAQVAVVAQGNASDLAALKEALEAKGIPSQIMKPPGSNPNA